FENVKVDVELKKRQEEMGVNRFKLMVGQPFKGLVDTEEWDMYKFGSVRSFSEYLRFSGITFADGKTDEHSCKQLHWVPYEKPAEIESMLPGWHLHRSGHENSPENGQIAEATTTAVTAPNVRQEKPVNFGIEATIEHPERVTYSGSLAFMGFGIVLFGVVNIPQQVMPTSADTPMTIRALLPQMRSVLHEMLPFVDALAAAVESEAASVDIGDSDGMLLIHMSKQYDI
ncbi:hypothetical protein DYB31_013503, partial [Aphanomyces astaci]